MTNRTPRTEAFMDRAIHAHGDAVFRLALNQLRNVTDAQDAVQETFVRLLTSETRFDNENHLRAWLLRVAINICRDIHKSAWNRRVEGLENERHADARDSLTTVSAEEIALRALKDHPVWNALANLPEDQRLIIHLAYIEGRSSDEIAQLLGIKPATVRTRLFRARRRLREILGETENPIAPTRPRHTPSVSRGDAASHAPPTH